MTMTDRDRLTQLIREVLGDVLWHQGIVDEVVDAFLADGWVRLADIEQRADELAQAVDDAALNTVEGLTEWTDPNTIRRMVAVLREADSE
jgi:hypothetical protein